MNSVHSFEIFPRALRFLPQSIPGSGYEIDAVFEMKFLPEPVSRYAQNVLPLIMRKSIPVFNVTINSVDGRASENVEITSTDIPDFTTVIKKNIIRKQIWINKQDADLNGLYFDPITESSSDQLIYK